MTKQSTPRGRVFKNSAFAKLARKADIDDEQLCTAIRQVMNGQCDDLGGGVFKKRLNKNLHRSIIVAKGGGYWLFVFLFAKKDRENIQDDELRAFRALAKAYEHVTETQLTRLLDDNHLTEICHGDPA